MNDEKKDQLKVLVMLCGNSHQHVAYDGKLKVGVDLWTANIVLAIVDQEGNPIAGASQEAKVVKDGIVVDYIGAVNILEKLKHDIEEMLKINLNYSAIAVPPGTIDGNVKVISNVVESVGMDVVDIIDEPTAAATVLGIQDGAVVDVGGGTTGISILKEGKVIERGNHDELLNSGGEYSRMYQLQSKWYQKSNQAGATLWVIFQPFWRLL